MVTVQEAARILGVSVDTIRRWEKKKLITAKRSKHNYRIFDIEELKRVQSKYLGQLIENKFEVLKDPQKTRVGIIELCAGAGGMALGFENAGLRTKLLVDIDKDCVKTLSVNRPLWRVIHDDIANVNFSKHRYGVKIVAAGIPCQAFSYAGLGKGFEDTRGTLFFEFIRCVREIEPKIAVIENVRGLIEHDGGRTLDIMLKTLEDLGYEPCYKLLRAQFLDVPQKRERVVIIAVRKDLGIRPIFPKEKDYTISLREALKDCPTVGRPARFSRSSARLPGRRRGGRR